MSESRTVSWDDFREFYSQYPALELALDFSRIAWPEGFLDRLQPEMEKAFDRMEELEGGAIANPDENRMVGHYWLRAPDLAPTPEIRRAIEETVDAIEEFSEKVHRGELQGQGGAFRSVLLIGIGGSALGPQFVGHALGHPVSDKLKLWVFDNTDPDGIDRVLAEIGDLSTTLCIVISKSGGTKETRNGMLEAKAAYERAGLEFSKHAVATTQSESELDKITVIDSWLARFPMWDWVGGRTSELSAVGLLPAALQGIDIRGMLAGAQECDMATRRRDYRHNPAAMMALAWFASGNGKGDRNLVILPYKDRLALISKYLQQLIMESLGKELDLDGHRVNQGLTVLGNKGSTDQHSFVQQLRDGQDNFIVIFIQVLKDRDSESIKVERSLESADFLQGFLLGTRQALWDKGRQSVTISVGEVSPRTVGALIALFERSVGLYASLVNINAYHQPGVEAGKKAASKIVEIKGAVLELLTGAKGNPLSCVEIASAIGHPEETELVWMICARLAQNPRNRVIMEAGDDPESAKFTVE